MAQERELRGICTFIHRQSPPSWTMHSAKSMPENSHHAMDDEEKGSSDLPTGKKHNNRKKRFLGGFCVSITAKGRL